MTKDSQEDTAFIKKGLLYKRRNGLGRMMPNSWQYRFFTLTSDGVLNYYDMGHDTVGVGGEEGKPRGQLALGYINYNLIREPSIDGAPTKFALQIHPEGGEEKWSMCADTDADHSQWCLELEQFLHVNNAKGTKLASYDNDGADPSAARTPTKKRDDTPVPAVKANLPSPSLPKSAKTTGGGSKKASTKGGGKVFLKMQKKESEGLFTIDRLESSMALVISNLCFYLAYTYTVSKSTLGPFLGGLGNALCSLKLGVAIKLCRSLDTQSTLAVVYVVVGNWIVAKTMSLRASRIRTLELERNDLKSELAAAVKVAEVAAAQAASSPSGATADVTTVDDAAIEDSGPVLVNGKPVPGCTLEEVFTPQRLSKPHTWSKIDSSEFNVRIGPNYSWNKKKAPSPPALYEPFAVDIFSTSARIDHATERFSLPENLANVDTGHKGVPPIFVVQIQIPLEEPSLFTKVTDGPGWSIMMYFKISDQTLKELKDINTASPAVRLWAKWCSEAMNVDDLRKRFKFISSCSNLVELGVSQSIAQYNAKPILIRRTGTLYRGVNNTYMEFDMHIHKFDAAAKKAIHFMTSKAAEMFMQIAFVIEGRDDDELPEAIFGAIACNKPQEELANFIFD
jgi:hypothetical protein